MSKKELHSFIQKYEKISKWMIKKMPKLANFVIYVKKNQKIYKIKRMNHESFY